MANDIPQSTGTDRAEDAVAATSESDAPERGWLGWVVSGTVHAAVLALLATIVIQQALDVETPPRVVEAPPPVQVPEKPKPKDIVEKQKVLEQLKEADVTSPDTMVEVSDLTPSTEDKVEKEQTLKGREDALADSEMGGSGLMPAIGAGGGARGPFGFRDAGGRIAALKDGGGSRGTEGTMDRGLRWLMRHQDKASGAWNPVSYPANCDEDPKCEPGTRGTGNSEVAMTGYAVLCFLGAGHDHKSAGRYKHTVEKGLAYLLSQVGADGRFTSARNYEQGIAATALFEAYGMTQDPALKDACEKTLAVILDTQAQDPNAKDAAYAGLGWDYTKANPKRIDSSVSGWNVMALKSAAMAGFGDAKKGLDGAKVWLKRAWEAANKAKMPEDAYGDSWFPYTWNATDDSVQGTNGSNKAHDLTCVGMVCAAFLGHEAGDPMLETMANHVLKHQKPTSVAAYNSYYTYYNTLGMFQVGGEKWKEWNAAFSKLLMDMQVTGQGCLDGSWNPTDGIGWHGSEVGRVLSTTYAILNLQVYYRYKQTQGGKAAPR